MNMNTYRQQLLTDSVLYRQKEIVEYTVNIDNFTLALKRIEGKAHLAEFSKQLHTMLTSALLEREKAQVILDVVQEQLKDLQSLETSDA